MSIAPVIVPPERGNLAAILFVKVVEKFASSPIAAANSLSVSNAAGAEATNVATALSAIDLISEVLANSCQSAPTAIFGSCAWLSYTTIPLYVVALGN